MKKNIFKVFTLALVCIGLVACSSNKAATNNSESSVESISKGDEGVRKTGILVMATNAEFPPYEYHENNEIVGIDVEIAKAIAEKLELKLDVKDMAFDAIMPSVSSGKADIGLAGMTVTDERKANVDFTDTYAHSSQVVIVKNDSDIASPDDLKGKKIGVQLGTTGDLYSANIEGASVERFPKGLDAVVALSQGKIDAVVIDSLPAKSFVENVEGTKILDKEFTSEDYAIAIKKGNTALVENINKAIKELKEDGTLDKITEKYIK